MTAGGVLVELYSRTQKEILGAIEPLTNEDLHRRMGLQAPSIAFHVWHVARWADYVQEVAGRTIGDETASQIWVRDGVADRWGLTGANFGDLATGMGLSDEDSEKLALPEKRLLLDYAKAAFEASASKVGPLTEEQMAARPIQPPADPPRPGSSLGAVVGHYTKHASRHLGMIEALKGVMGMHGTATR